jgi:adenylate cyclase
MPIYDRFKKVFAVAQLLNKKTGGPFTKVDEQRFRDFASQLGVLLESCLQLGQEPQPLALPPACENDLPA